jgi:citrate lyase beta subunit
VADRQVPASHRRPLHQGLPNRDPSRNPHGRRAVDRMLNERARRQREGEAARETTRPLTKETSMAESKKRQMTDPLWGGHDFNPEPGSREPGHDSDAAHAARVASANAATEVESEAVRILAGETLHPDHGGSGEPVG